MWNTSFHNAGAVILAAGEGKRMKSPTPKVMTLLRDRPLIDFVVCAVEASGVGGKPVVVVSGAHTAIQDFLGDRASYAIQAEQLGTGHATGVAKPFLAHVSHVLVLYGDMPFLRPESILHLAAEHREEGNALTMMTVRVPNFSGEFSPFGSFGRILRSPDGAIQKIVEQKDATDAERAVTEVNPSFFCFEASWLWSRLPRLTNANAQGEYYLTDLVKMAMDEGAKIGSIPIEPSEAIGINTSEDLSAAAQMLHS